MSLPPACKKKRILAFFFKEKNIKCLISSIRGFSCRDRHNLIVWAKGSPCSLPGIFLNCSATRNELCPWDVCIEYHNTAFFNEKVTFFQSFLLPSFTGISSKISHFLQFATIPQCPLNTSISVSHSCKWTFSEFPGNLFQAGRPAKETLHMTSEQTGCANLRNLHGGFY